MVPKSSRTLVINACHDLPSSGGHLAFKGTFDKVRDRYWWPTIHSDGAEHVESCLPCLRHKTSHRSPTQPTGQRLATRPFQVVAVDLVEYKSKWEGNRFILSVLDHLTRFLILIPTKSKEAAVLVVRHLIDRVFGFRPTGNPAFRLREGISKPTRERIAACLWIQENPYRRLSSARELLCCRASRACSQHRS